MSKKILLVVLGIVAFSYMNVCFAQDVIVTRDAKRIDAKVTEINAENVKYKLFEHQNGPTYTLPRGDIVSIVYQNGEVETFEIKAAIPSTPRQTTPAQTQYVEPTSITAKQTQSVAPASIIAKQTPCAPRNAFGLDIGTGVLFDVDDPSFGGSIGFRYLHHFSPYFGVDFIKFNTIIDYIYEDTYQQFMTGIRLNTKNFNSKCFSGYGAFRIGTGSWEFEDWDFCTEVEIGLNLTRTLFIGYSSNFQIVLGDLLHFHAVRLGFNFHGKKQNYRFESK